MIAQRLNVNHTAHVGGSGTVFLPSHYLSLIVDDKGATAECVDGGIFFGIEIIGAHVGGHEVHIVIEGTSAALNLEDLVAGSRVWIRRAIHHFGPIHSQCTCVFGIGAFIRHHDAQAADLRIGYRPEGIQGATVTLYPPVPDIMGADRVFNRE